MAHRTPPGFTVDQLEIHPLAPERWDDLADLFGKSGADGGCWCMWWRIPGKDWRESAKDEHREALRGLVCSGAAQGLLAYHAGKAVGWCSLGPRSDFARLDTSRYWQAVDDAEVWSVVCFFIRRQYRGQQVATRLLAEAIVYARQKGAKILEAYARDTGDQEVNDTFLYTGKYDTYIRAGFVEVARRHETYPIMRLDLTSVP